MRGTTGQDFGVGCQFQRLRGSSLAVRCGSTFLAGGLTALWAWGGMVFGDILMIHEVANGDVLTFFSPESRLPLVALHH